LEIHIENLEDHEKGVEDLEDCTEKEEENHKWNLILEEFYEADGDEEDELPTRLQAEQRR